MKNQCLKHLNQTSQTGSALVVIIIAVVVVLAVAFSTVSSFLAPTFFISLFDEAISKNGDTSITRSKAAVSTLDINGGKVQLVNAKESKTKVSISKEPESSWPEKTIAGLFKLNTNDSKFDKLISFQAYFDKYPGAGFALGYWYPDTQEWVYTPTIQRSWKVYEAPLSHASFISGRQITVQDAVTNTPDFITNPLIKQRLEQFRNLYSETQQKNGDVEEWSEVGRLVEEMADIITEDCASNQSVDNQMTFYHIWGLAQLLDLEKIDRKMSEAEQSCRKNVKSNQSAYIIHETDLLDNSKQFGNLLTFEHKTVVRSDGKVVEDIVTSKKENGWRGNWEVKVYYTGETSGKGSSLLTPYWPTWGGGAFDQAIFLFSLEGVKEGGTFDVEYISVGESNGYLYGPYKRIQHNVNYTGNELTRMGKGKLVKDFGDAGAVIEFGSQLTSEQQAQIDQAEEYLKQIPQFSGWAKKAVELKPLIFTLRKIGTPEPTPESNL